MVHPKVDADLIAELTAQLEKNSLTELEWSEGNRTIRVVRNFGIASISAQPAPVSTPVHKDAATASSGPGPGDVTSPMVGTVYVAPEPNSPPYAQIGDTVTKGQTVFIVEAMKTMNPITAHMSGKVTAVLIANGDAVEYDQALMTIV